MNDDAELWNLARKAAKDKVAFQVHLATYIAGSIFFAVVWLITSNYNTNVFPWFIIPIAGWGIGVAAHFAVAYRGGSHLRSMADKEFKKMKAKV